MATVNKEHLNATETCSHFSAILLVIAVVAGTIYYQSQSSKAAAEAYRRDRTTYVRDYSPSTGSPTAKVEIVEFFDPACDTCKQFYPMVKQLMDDHPGQIRLYERYAPFHSGSESVVKILAAAHMQGKFWPTLEAVFAAQSDWAPNHRPQPELVWNDIRGVGLDMGRLRQDMNSPLMDTIVQRTWASAKAERDRHAEFFATASRCRAGAGRRGRRWSKASFSRLLVRWSACGRPIGFEQRKMSNVDELRTHGLGSGSGGMLGIAPMALWWVSLIVGIVLLGKWLFNAETGRRDGVDAAAEDPCRTLYTRRDRSGGVRAETA